MNGIRYMAKWFSSKKEAENFKKEHGGVIYSGEPNSSSRYMHYETSVWYNFNPEKYPYSVNWAEETTSLPNMPVEFFLD